MIRSLLAILFFAVTAFSIQAQTTTFSNSGLVVDVFLSNPCEGSPNGSILFKVVATPDGQPAKLQVIVGPPNLFAQQLIPVNGTYRFDPLESLPVEGYEFIIADNTETILINTFGSPLFLTALPDIVVTDDPSTDLTNSNCT